MILRAKKYPDIDLFEIHTEYANAPPPQSLTPAGDGYMQFKNAESGDVIAVPAAGGRFNAFKRAMGEIVNYAARTAAKAGICPLKARNAETAEESRRMAIEAIKMAAKQKELEDYTAELEKTTGLKFV